MLAPHTAPRGRIAAVLATQSDPGDEAFGIIIRPPRVQADATVVRAPRPRLWTEAAR